MFTVIVSGAGVATGVSLLAGVAAAAVGVVLAAGAAAAGRAATLKSMITALPSWRTLWGTASRRAMTILAAGRPLLCTCSGTALMTFCKRFSPKDFLKSVGT